MRKHLKKGSDYGSLDLNASMLRDLSCFREDSDGISSGRGSKLSLSPDGKDRD